MKKFEKLIAEHADTQARREALSGRIEELKKLIEERQAEAEDAAGSGDVSGYMSKKAEADRMAAEQHVAEVQRDKIPTFMEVAECVKVWEDYNADYNKRIEPMREDYKNAMRELSDKFFDIVHEYNAACRTRERLARMCGVEPGRVETVFHMKEINSADYPGDANFFQRRKLASYDKANLAGGVFLTHRSNHVDAV